MGEGLEESELKFRALTESTASAIFVLQNQKFCYVNPATVAISGYTRTELLRMSFWEIVHPNFRDLIQVKDLVRPGEQSSRYEIKIRTKNSEERWVDLDVELLGFTEKSTILGTAFDVTDRKRVEEALRVSEEKFSKAFRSSPDSISISTLKDGRVIEVNDSFLQITSYSREEVIGRTSLELNIWANPGDRALMQQILQQRGAVRNLKAGFRMKSGEVVVGLLSAEIIDLGGEQCLMMVSRDITSREQTEEALLRAKVAEAAKQALEKEITERKRVEEALRVSEEKFSTAFRSSPDAISISTLKDGRMIEANDSSIRLTGYARSEMIGRTSLELNFWANLADRALMQRLLHQQGAVRDLESSFRVKSGEVRVGLVSAEIINLGGEPCLLMVTRDITDRKRAEEQLFHHAFYDRLTGLPNRALFMDRLGHALECSNRRETTGLPSSSWT